MKFSYEEAHIWLQQALCLETMGRHIHALAILGEVSRLLPTKVMPCLIAARICYQHLNLVTEYFFSFIRKKGLASLKRQS